MTETLCSGLISTRLQRIAELARQHPHRVFDSMSHAIDLDWLKEAYRRTRKDGAVGVDGQTAAVYASNLDRNLRNLLVRFRDGSYRAPAVRRVHIPKDSGKTRPIGIPTFEDKVLQRAVAMMLEALYEPVFHRDSYGFRPRRSAHDALVEVQCRPTFQRHCWAIEADIEGFFDAIDHKVMRSFLDQRIRDGVLRRAVHKWLAANVMAEGTVIRSVSGTPQGGVISPVLANVYLHEVLDRWFEAEVRPRMRGKASFVRYADDFVLLFEREDDARRVMAVLPQRFARFGLRLHPEKTRLLPFSSPDIETDCHRTSFDFLGFTHFWARSRKGRQVVKQRTSKERFSRGLKRLRAWMRQNRHRPLAEQHRALCLKLAGHYGYYGITGNSDALRTFRREVTRDWGRALARRGGRRFTWTWFQRVLARFPLPPARAVRSVVPSEPAA